MILYRIGHRYFWHFSQAKEAWRSGNPHIERIKLHCLPSRSEIVFLLLNRKDLPESCVAWRETLNTAETRKLYASRTVG